jgi:hypothetical protein
MSKVSEALGLDMGMADEAEPMLDEGLEPMEKPQASASAEVLAMKQFERAATPEAKVQAMKDFLEACGLY